MGMFTIPKEGDSYGFSKSELEAFSDKIAYAVKNRGLSVPVIMTLEVTKPLSFVGYSAFIVLRPILDVIFDSAKLQKLQALLADRNRIERLIQTIERLEKTKQDIKKGESREQS